ncbi:ATP-binding protein [Allosediminivita pacifica]|uniref:Anti-sigma regulatory factor (Ser/Thr protein kinase) n=1 Tax=Allosediminivita pacifica TaxID=1267769 RepID=A0A2T6B3U7_9RHOB|nr:ATP-binding protein [Allosediminivita pacifica]PTX50734.1 anti-sigma regulatory factor (Ser/Thr protein kinase) [Allosediminivita pacifica]GGB00770.1 hypothetical protein GCM10011324_08800 [Allosediminivita pacifica]
MTIVLEMPPSLGEVDPVVISLKAQLEAALSEDKLSALEIAVTEALANAVKHGDTGSAGQPIRVVASIGEAEVRVEIIDAGRQGAVDLFKDVGDIAEVDPLAENGRGLSLICHFVDGLRFEPAEGRNRLELTFLREAGA